MWMNARWGREVRVVHIQITIFIARHEPKIMFPLSRVLSMASMKLALRGSSQLDHVYTWDKYKYPIPRVTHERSISTLYHVYTWDKYKSNLYPPVSIPL